MPPPPLLKCQKIGLALQLAAHSLGQIELLSKVDNNNPHLA